MPDDGGLGTRAASAKDVDSSNGPPANRCTRRDDFGVRRERRGEVIQKSEVIGISMIRIEPRVVCQAG
jgi:hypothetical protein